MIKPKCPKLINFDPDVMLMIEAKALALGVTTTKYILEAVTLHIDDAELDRRLRESAPVKKTEPMTHEDKRSQDLAATYSG